MEFKSVCLGLGPQKKNPPDPDLTLTCFTCVSRFPLCRVPFEAGGASSNWGALGDSWGCLGASWGPPGSLVGPLGASWRPKNGPRAAKSSPRAAPEWPRAAQERPRGHLGGRLGRLGRLLGRLGPSWGRLGAVLGRLWEPSRGQKHRFFWARAHARAPDNVFEENKHLEHVVGASWERLGRHLGPTRGPRKP